MRSWVILFVCIVTLVGCSIRVNENGSDLEDERERDSADHRSDLERAADVCDPYCIDLIDCGVLSDRAFTSCRDLCLDRFEADARAVTEGCACVQAAQCQAEAALECVGDPLPGILADPTADHPDNGAAGSSDGGDYSLDD